jgi:hypothetical protein
VQESSRRAQLERARLRARQSQLDVPEFLDMARALDVDSLRNVADLWRR